MAVPKCVPADPAQPRFLCGGDEPVLLNAAGPKRLSWNDAQRAAFLKPVLEELGFSAQQIHSLVVMTGATHGRKYGYTYSDLAQRLLPGLLLAAYPSSAITFDLAKDVVERHPPTPPFRKLESHE
jgi:hypothetical protein